MPPRKKVQNGGDPPGKDDAQAATLEKGDLAKGSITDYAQMQSDELEALRSIYMDDFTETETKPTAWSKAPEPSFQLRLKASSKPELTVTLAGQLPATYPKSLPNLRISNGLSDLRKSTQNELLALIKQKPKALLGEVMIFDLATQIEEILEACAQAQLEDPALPSLEAERIEQEAVAAQKAEAQELEQLRKKEAASAANERQLAEEVELVRRQREQKRSRRKSRSSFYDDSATFDDGTESPSLSFDQETPIKIADGTFDSFRHVAGKTLVEQGAYKTVSTVKPLLHKADNRARAALLVLEEYTFHEPKSEVSEGSEPMTPVEAMTRTEEKLEAMKNMHHENLIKLLNFKITREQGESLRREVKVSVLSEYANKGPLSDLLEMVGSVSAEKTRTWTHQLLDALNYYHRNGLVHGSINSENVMLSMPKSGSGTTVKLAFGVKEYLPQEQGSKKKSQLATSRSAFWSPPELTQRNPKRTSKSDIWDLGVVILQMAFGLNIMEQHTSAKNLASDLEISDSLTDLTTDVFRSDPKKRPTAFELQTSAFLRSQGPIWARDSFTEDSPAHAYRRGSVSRRTMTMASRYENDFIEVGRLGKGGFGEVVKAKHRVDGQFYAVKKITYKKATSTGLQATLHEVILLSQLRHPYIVRYSTAWIEDIEDDNADDELESTEDDMTDDANEEAVYTGGETTEETADETDPLAELDRALNAPMDLISQSNSFIKFGNDSDDESCEEDDDTASVITESLATNASIRRRNGKKGDLWDTESSGEEDGQSREDGREPAEQGNYSDNTEELSISPVLQRKVSREQKSMKSILYMQMEYCEKHTLRDFINNNLAKKEDEGWRLFRQILEGLAHVHSLGMIHRDLKPDNVFIDDANNPRIGDFGLATLGAIMTSVGTQPDIGGSLTGGVGTYFYLAPEVRSSTGQYDAKVDMYSLGIIFFEMCSSLTTGMERDLTLQKIREKEHKLPEIFSTPEKAAQGKIIESLIQHDPSLRPKAQELLDSGQLPVKAEDETLRQTLLGLTDSNSDRYRKILNTIFAQGPKKVDDIVWDIDPENVPGTKNPLLDQLIAGKLRQIFTRHGAVESNRQMIFPRSASHYKPKTVRLMDPHGNQLQLPYDLTLSHARSLPRQPSIHEKTFAIGTVYRENPEGGQPSQLTEVDFDFVSHNALDLDLREAEVIKVLDEVLDGFPSLKRQKLAFAINHSDLLDDILDVCHIKASSKAAVIEILAKFGTNKFGWDQARIQLRHPEVGVGAVSVEELKKFSFQDTPGNALAQLKILMGNAPQAHNLAPLFVRMSGIIKYAQSFGVKRPIRISPLAAYNVGYYRGSIMFQCFKDTPKKEPVAAGGRYDRLCQEFSVSTPFKKGKNDSSKIHAVGFTISFELISRSMEQFLKNPTKSFSSKHGDGEGPNHWKTRRCDVLVASYDPEVLRLYGVNILQDLWANDISAELATDAALSFEDIANRYKDEHSWLILIRHDGNGRSLKVRSMVRREDSEIKTSELVSWLKHELRHRTQKEAAVNTVEGTPRLLRQQSQQQEYHQHSGANDKIPVIHVITPQHKSKKVNRTNIIEAAKVACRTVAENLNSGYVAAIDTSDTVLEAIRHTRLSDPESWRNFLNNAPPNEKPYLGELKEELMEFAAKANESDGEEEVGLKNAWIYNYRTDKIILYDLAV